MRIQHNIMAMNAYRNYTNNVSAMKQNLEKLSSGYKINRAGDDAAGLAISEKMRAQITGLQTAQKNAKDGISLVQTAEGALTEVHDMLNRMVELATQSANGTYDNDTDRNQLQKEMNQLLDEINRIADSSNFNGIKLLDGSMDASAISGVKYEAKTADEIAELLEDPDTAQDQTTVVAGGTVTETESTKATKAAFEISLDGVNVTAAKGDAFKLTIGDQSISTDALEAGTYTSSQLAKALDGKDVTIDGAKFIAKADGNVLKFTTTGSANLNASAKVTWTMGEGTEEEAVKVTQPKSTGAAVTDAVAGTSEATITFDLEGFDVDKAGTVTFAIAGKTYDVEITEDEFKAKDTTSLDKVAAKKLAAALNADKLTDATAGDFSVDGFTDGDTAITLKSANKAVIQDAGLKAVDKYTVAPKAAEDGDDKKGGEGTAASLEVGVSIDNSVTPETGDTIAFESDGTNKIDLTFTRGADGKWTTSDKIGDGKSYTATFDGTKLTITAVAKQKVDTSPFGDVSVKAVSLENSGSAITDTSKVAIANASGTWSAGADPQLMTFAGGVMALADEGSIAADKNGATPIEIVAAVEDDPETSDTDETADAVTATGEAKAQLAGLFDGLKATDGKVTVTYDSDNDKWIIGVGSKTVEATGTVADGVLSLKAEIDEEQVEVMTFTASDTSNAAADLQAFKDAFDGGVDTGLKYTAPTTDPGEGDGDKKTEEGGMTASDNLAGDLTQNAALSGLADFNKETSLTGAQATALKNAIESAGAKGDGKVTVKGVEIDLTAAGIDGKEKNVGEIATKIFDAAKAAVDEYNKTADKKVEVVGVSSDAEGKNWIVGGPKEAQQALTAKDGFYIQLQDAEEETPKATGASSGTINGGMQNVTSTNDGASARLANTTVDFNEVGAWTDGAKITIGDTTYTVAVGSDSKFKNASNVVDLTDQTGTVNTKVAAERLSAAANGNKTFTVGHDGTGKTTLQQKSAVKDSTDMTTKEKIASYLGVSVANADSLENAKPGTGLTLQIGDTADSYNKLKVDIKDMHAASLGLEGLSIADQDSAAEAIEKIKAAINTVSDVRGTLGATQNRLDHTINNLSVMTENIQDAESTIRDVDVAEEMMAYTKNNILIQSAQAMLAQANQVPQGVLQLLQ